MVTLLQTIHYRHQIEVKETTSDFEMMMFFIFFITFFIIAAYSIYKKHFEKNKLYGEQLNPDILVLAGIIIKGDENITDTELKYIKSKLDKDMSPKNSERNFNHLKKSLTEKQNLNTLIKNTNNFIITDVEHDFKLLAESNRIKIKWMHFLTSIATSDRVLTNKELDILEQIREGWALPKKTFNSILSMFNYYTEEDLNHQKQVKTYKESSYKKYYTILEIEETATEEEIKTAYRNLVKTYHPDKQIGKEKLNFNLAKQKFQAIQEAYDKIKQQKGI